MKTQPQYIHTLPWEQGAAECKYQFIYDALRATKNGCWCIWTFDTVEEAEKAQGAVPRYASHRDWVVETSRNGKRLGVRRMV